MSTELLKEIRVELEQLTELLNSHRPLIASCSETLPNAIERSALAALLHSFYTGLENIFVRVSLHADGTKPAGGEWHQALLRAMAAPTANRAAVISPQTVEVFAEYLAFRHVF